MRDDKTIHRERFGLTLLCTGLVFGILVVSIALIVLILYILSHFNVPNIPKSPEQVSTTSLIVLIAISGVIGATIAALASRFMMRPLNRLINQMNRLASGDFSARLEYGKPIQQHPAFRELTDSFNKMAQELESTEILRGDFVNNFSHEFKTPIVSIAGFAKLLRRANLTQEEQYEYLDVIEDESLRLSSMATNVLNLTKVENQAILTDVSRFNLSEQIRNCILLLESKWARKNIEFKIEFQEYMVSANEELLKQVWINLLDNAIKFSPEGGTVEIQIKQTGTQLCVVVMNNGEPIPAEQQKKIWNKFYQGDESHAAEGNGIGLALVYKIVQLHKGNVSVSCEGNIIAFTVVLPK